MAQAAVPRTGLGTKLVYGLGSVAFGTKDFGFSAFLLIFYSQVLGLPATAVSLAIMLALVSDAIFDPIIGQISDNWRSRLGRRHPFMYGAAIPIAIFYFLLWNPPHWQGAPLFFYLVVIAILVRMTIACYEIPSAALAPELSTDYDERTSLMGWRFLFGSVGGGITLAVALIFFMVATKAQPSGILNKSGYFAYSVMAALTMMISILLSSWGTHSRIPYLKQLPVTARPSLVQLARQMAESLSNRSLLILVIGALFGGVAGGLSSTLNTYFGTYFWRFTPQQLSVIGGAALLAAMLSVPLANFTGKRYGKRAGYIATALASLFVNNIAMTLKLFGLLPSGQTALLWIFFSTLTVGVAFAIASLILVTSMITDIVEDSEIKTGRRSEGLFSAALSFINKSTSGFGVLLAGVMIDLVHFPKQASLATVDAIAPDAPRNLVLLYMPVQLVLYLAAIVLIGRYRIDRATHEHNLKTLAETAAIAEVSPASEIMAGGSGNPREADGLLPSTARDA
ncbi:MAG TPA: MFS transporter [Rhizomicrobium sp.]|nr:MFS transporter [Rhizomicrobium sp.]